MHVEKAECAAKFWLHPDIEIAGSVGFRQRDLTKIAKTLEEQQLWFLEQWNEYFERNLDSKNPQGIGNYPTPCEFVLSTN